MTATCEVAVPGTREAARSGSGIGTTTLVVVTDSRYLDFAAAMLELDVARLDAAASRFRDDSELTDANQRAGTPVRVGAVLRDAARAALDMARATDGLVDPTVGARLVAAGYDRTFAQIPSRHGSLGRAASPTTTWRDVRLEPDGDGAWLTVPAGSALDLGAVAKAWLADRTAEQVAEYTGCGVLVDIGGDIAVAGPPPCGGWRIGLQDGACTCPEGSGCDAVAVESGGIATSSQGRRRWLTQDGPAHHIIDPRTGRPADTPWLSVTVAATTAAAANAASTSAMVLGPEAPAWLAGRGLSARLVPLGAGVPTLVGGWPAHTCRSTSESPHAGSPHEGAPS